MTHTTPDTAQGSPRTGDPPGRRSHQDLLVVASTLGGGTGSHLVRLLEQLDRVGWTVRLLCHDREPIPVPDGLEFIDDAPRGRLARFPLAQIAQVRRFRRVLREREPAVVHTYFYWPIIYGRLLKRTGAIRNLVENREDAGFAWGPKEYELLRRTAHLPDRVVCVSESVRDVVLEREGVGADRLSVIRNGVPLPASTGPTQDSRALRAELGFEPDHLVIGMVANLNRAVKGVHHFIDALPLIVERLPRARFVIVGDGPDRAALTERARRTGHGDKLVFAGFQGDVARFYRMMDLSVLTSLSEGLSITILESMSFGLPVVATRVGGNPELVVEGETGLLVPPAEPEAFGRAVVRALDDESLRHRMGAAGRRRVEREFAQEAVARRYVELYRELG